MREGLTCLKCLHPMMLGPFQLRERNALGEYSGDYRTASWYCANCHHAIWKGPSTSPPLTEEREMSQRDRPVFRPTCPDCGGSWWEKGGRIWHTMGCSRNPVNRRSRRAGSESPYPAAEQRAHSAVLGKLDAPVPVRETCPVHGAPEPCETCVRISELAWEERGEPVL